MEELLAEVAFAADVIVTASGRQVRERRLTAWTARSQEVGGFKYSGKTMPAQVPFSPAV